MFSSWFAKYGKVFFMVLVIGFVACKVSHVLLAATEKYSQVENSDESEAKKEGKTEVDEKAKKQDKQSEKQIFHPAETGFLSKPNHWVDGYNHPILSCLYYNVLTPPPLAVIA